MDDFSSVETMNVFKDFIRAPKDQMTLLGASISRGHALDKVLQAKVDDLERAVNRLKLLQAHDALVLLKNSLSMPHLLYTLRTSDCRDHRLLSRSDFILRTELTSILNVEFNDTHWLQATLPVRNGGIGIRTASTLATSAFVASAASTHALQQAILPSSHSNVVDEARISAEATWKSTSLTSLPKPAFQHIQKAWDGPVVNSIIDRMVSAADTDIDLSPTLRRLASCGAHCVGWP